MRGRAQQVLTTGMPHTTGQDPGCISGREAVARRRRPAVVVEATKELAELNQAGE